MVKFFPCFLALRNHAIQFKNVASDAFEPPHISRRKAREAPPGKRKPVHPDFAPVEMPRSSFDFQQRPGFAVHERILPAGLTDAGVRVSGDDDEIIRFKDF